MKQPRVFTDWFNFGPIRLRSRWPLDIEWECPTCNCIHPLKPDDTRWLYDWIARTASLFGTRLDL